MITEQIWAAIGAIGCMVSGGVVGWLSMGNWDWYETLKKPPFQPPNWLFGPVWTALYALMGIAFGSLIANRASLGIWLFILQFILNLTWTPLFFRFKQIGPAFINIIALWIAIVGTIWATVRTSLTIFSIPTWALLIPYIAWVTFASILNGTIYFLNRD